MTKHELMACVRCGNLFFTSLSDVFRRDAKCAPCCHLCEAYVRDEVARNVPFWPDAWYGRWCWSARVGRWEVSGPRADFTFEEDVRS